MDVPIGNNFLYGRFLRGQFFYRKEPEISSIFKRNRKYPPSLPPGLTVHVSRSSSVASSNRRRTFSVFLKQTFGCQMSFPVPAFPVLVLERNLSWAFSWTSWVGSSSSWDRFLKPMIFGAGTVTAVDKYLKRQKLTGTLIHKYLQEQCG